MNYYNRDGRPITLEEFMETFEDPQYKIVERTTLKNPKGDGEDILVSTVWLGADHGFGTGLPIIFETMVFGGNLSGYEQRYSTELEALTGHADAVKKVLEVMYDDI